MDDYIFDQADAWDAAQSTSSEVEKLRIINHRLSAALFAALDGDLEPARTLREDGHAGLLELAFSDRVIAVLRAWPELGPQQDHELQWYVAEPTEVTRVVVSPPLAAGLAVSVRCGNMAAAEDVPIDQYGSHYTTPRLDATLQRNERILLIVANRTDDPHPFTATIYGRTYDDLEP